MIEKSQKMMKKSTNWREKMWENKVKKRTEKCKKCQNKQIRKGQKIKTIRGKNSQKMG